MCSIPRRYAGLVVLARRYRTVSDFLPGCVCFVCSEPCFHCGIRDIGKRTAMCGLIRRVFGFSIRREFPTTIYVTLTGDAVYDYASVLPPIETEIAAIN